MTTDAQSLHVVERVLAALGYRLDMVDVEARRDERSVAIFTRAPLADADALSFLGRPLVPHNTTDLEANAFRDLRHRFAAVHELPTGVEVQLLDSYLEDSSKDFVILRHFANYEERARFGAHDQRRRYIGTPSVSPLDADLGSEMDLFLKGRFVFDQVSAVKIQALLLSV